MSNTTKAPAATKRRKRKAPVKRRPIGAPPKICQKMVDELLGHCEDGAFDFVAAEAVGIARKTFWQWRVIGEREIARREAGERADRRYDLHVKLARDLPKAHATAEVARLQRIDRAAEAGAWQADAWFLERKYPDRYALKQKVQVELPPEQQAEAIRELMQRFGHEHTVEEIRATLDQG